MKLTRQILSQTAHRPWPLPSGPWLMEQGWYDLLFAHWEVPQDTVRSLIPRNLDLDTYNGRPWVSIAAFFLRMRLRGLSVTGRIWSFPELNFRTYVTCKGRPGIYFFSLDAASLSAVIGARLLYRLPYFHARMAIRRDCESIVYHSRRLRARGEFSASYRPISAEFNAAPGTLSHWLAERYCLFAVHGSRVLAGEIHHPPWSLRNAQVEIRNNSVPQEHGVKLDATPDLVQFAAAQEVLVWPPRPA